MVAGAGADLALELRVRQFFVRDCVLLHPLLRGIDDAGPHGETEPLVAGIAQRCRDFAGDAAEVTGCANPLSAASTRRPTSAVSNTIDRAHGPFLLHALDQAFLCEDHFHLNAGLLLEGIEAKAAINCGWR